MVGEQPYKSRDMGGSDSGLGHLLINNKLKKTNQTTLLFLYESERLRYKNDTTSPSFAASNSMSDTSMSVLRVYLFSRISYHDTVDDYCCHIFLAIWFLFIRLSKRVASFSLRLVRYGRALNCVNGCSCAVGYPETKAVCASAAKRGKKFR